MILIMLGAPGTGKGTVAGILSKELNIPAVSSGDIFRKAIQDRNRTWQRSVWNIRKRGFGF